MLLKIAQSFKRFSATVFLFCFLSENIVTNRFRPGLKNYQKEHIVHFSKQTSRFGSIKKQT